MKQETSQQFAAILAAAQAKLNAVNAPKPVVYTERITPVTPPIQPEAIVPTPELSEMTIDELLGNVASPIVIPSLEIVDYSDKAFAIIGETKARKDELARLGGKFNKYLRCGAGWIFPKTRLKTVKQALAI